MDMNSYITPFLLLICACSCAPAPVGRASVSSEGSPTVSADGPGCMAPSLTMEDTLRSIAANYAKWQRVDEWNHWAPEMCRMQRSTARISASEDAATHGGKLYYLYAKDRAAYMASATQDQPVGQVIVKESWKPVELPASELADAAKAKAAGGHGFAERGGKLWKPGEKNGLFVMMKLVPGASGTDNGWLYATTSPDGSVVHESGRIASCMGCHESGTHDRMFGLKQ
jgi:hypothetical protein